ncbi:MAG: hypothetical protein WAL32_10975 [Terriglobales bacterium]
MKQIFKRLGFGNALLGLAFSTMALSASATAQDQGQDQQEDPPSRVARIGYLEGSVSFQPAGETDWVGAVPNRPLTTGDQLWSDQDSRAELQLGSAGSSLLNESLIAPGDIDISDDCAKYAFISYT